MTRHPQFTSVSKELTPVLWCEQCGKLACSLIQSLQLAFNAAAHRPTCTRAAPPHRCGCQAHARTPLASAQRLPAALQSAQLTTGAQPQPRPSMRCVFARTRFNGGPPEPRPPLTQAASHAIGCVQVKIGSEAAPRQQRSAAPSTAQHRKALFLTTLRAMHGSGMTAHGSPPAQPFDSMTAATHSDGELLNSSIWNSSIMHCACCTPAY